MILTIVSGMLLIPPILGKGEKMQGRNFLFVPGPTNIPERLRHAVNVPTIDHRSASFGAIGPQTISRAIIGMTAAEAVKRP